MIILVFNIQLMMVLSWNIQGAWPGTPKERVRNQIDFIDGYENQPDILFLQEVNKYRTEIREYLNEIGYHTIEDTLDWASELGDSTVQPQQDISHTNGNLTAVRDGAGLTRKPLDILGEEFNDVDIKSLDTHYPEKILVTDYDIKGHTVECWNVRAVPGSMKGEEKSRFSKQYSNELLIPKKDSEYSRVISILLMRNCVTGRLSRIYRTKIQEFAIGGEMPS